ncbi:MAG: Bax inhibitor-1/YccA family protein [Pseudomonadota bacterium]
MASLGGYQLKAELLRIGLRLYKVGCPYPIGRADMMIQSGAPRSWSWSLGMALCASIVWLYMELLRFLSIANR